MSLLGKKTWQTQTKKNSMKLGKGHTSSTCITYSDSTKAHIRCIDAQFANWHDSDSSCQFGIQYMYMCVNVAHGQSVWGWLFYPPLLGPHCSRMDVEKRQHLLLRQYFFHCQCEACKLELADRSRTLPLTFNDLKCEKCGSFLKVTWQVSLDLA